MKISIAKVVRKTTPADVLAKRQRRQYDALLKRAAETGSRVISPGLHLHRRATGS